MAQLPSDIISTLEELALREQRADCVRAMFRSLGSIEAELTTYRKLPDAKLDNADALLKDIRDMRVALLFL